MLSVNEARETMREIAPSLKGVSRDKKLILEGIMIGVRLTEDKMHDKKGEDSRTCKAD